MGPSITDLIDTKKLGPEQHRISTYINHVLEITAFEMIESKIKHKGGEKKPTVKFKFKDLTDGSADEFEVTTSATYIVGQLRAIKEQYKFGTPESPLASFTAKVAAELVYGKPRNFSFVNPNSPDVDIKHDKVADEENG